MNYKQKAANYAKAVELLNKHLDDDLFEIMLGDQCELLQLNPKHLRMIMGLEEFRLYNADPRLVAMTQKGKQKESAMKPTKESIKTMAVRIIFYRGTLRYHYYSINHEESEFYFKQMIEGFLGKIKILPLKKMRIHKSILHSLDLETQLMLIQAGEDNYHKIRL